MYYNYPIHYLYDLLAIGMILYLARQIFNLSLTIKQVVAFLIWMMMFYQINFYIIIPHFQREFKYAILYLGLYLGFSFIIKLNVVGSLLVITTTSAMNGIFTNINLFFMLNFIFPNYGIALEYQHLQYSCYVVSIVILSLLTRVFKFKICDLQRYI